MEKNLSYVRVFFMAEYMLVAPDIIVGGMTVVLGYFHSCIRSNSETEKDPF